MLVEISLCHCIHDIPRRGKRIGQLIKQASAIPDFINDPEGFIDNVFFVPLKAIVLNRYLHFFFNGADAVQVFKIIDYIENNRCAFPVCRQSSSDLLFVNNRRNRRTKQYNTADIIHMNAFIQRVNTEKQPQMSCILVRFEIRKGLAG